MRLLIYIYNNGGEIKGFRETSQKMKLSYGRLRDALLELELHGLLTREISGIPPTSKYRLTEKGKKAAELLIKLIETVEKNE